MRRHAVESFADDRAILTALPMNSQPQRVLTLAVDPLITLHL